MKIYEVTFIKYTNGLKDTVWNEKDNSYLDVGKQPFLVTEKQLKDVQQYGCGINTCKFVGNLLEEITNEQD